MNALSVEISLNCHSSDDDSLSIGEQQVVAEQSTCDGLDGVVVGGLTLEEETESLNNFEVEGDNVGLDTRLVAVTGMNTGGEVAEVGSEEGADMRLVGEDDMDGEKDDGMV